MIASWRNSGWSYLYTKNVITCFEWRIVGQFHCDILDIRIFTTFNSHLDKNSYWIMVKIGNENASHALKLLYANNHFEPIITCDCMIKFSNIHTYATYDTKLKTHNINNENNEVQHKWKRFNWNFELNKNLLEIIKIHPEWLPQEIALVFFFFKNNI